MQTQDQRETTSETTSIIIENEEDLKPAEAQLETPKPENEEIDKNQDQMQDLISQMAELEKRLLQSEDKVKNFEQKTQGPSTKEFIGAKANEAKEFMSLRQKEASALGSVIATACGDALTSTQETIFRYRNLLMSLVAMIFVGFLVKHEVKQSNEIHSLTQTVQSLQHGLMQSQYHVDNLSQNMQNSNLHLNSLIQNQASDQQAEAQAKTDQNFLDFLASQKEAEAAQNQIEQQMNVQAAQAQQEQMIAQINSQIAQRQAEAARHAEHLREVEAQRHVESQRQQQAAQLAAAARADQEAKTLRMRQEMVAQQQAEIMRQAEVKKHEEAMRRTQATHREKYEATPQQFDLSGMFGTSYRKINSKSKRIAHKLLNELLPPM